MSDKTDTLDLVNRDPNCLNQNLKVGFDDVLGEPDDIHSIDCVWKLSYTCFNCWLNLCYKIATILCGICIATMWGCEFAQIAFYHVWCITPCMRVLDINCAVLRQVYNHCTNCCVAPCCEAMGQIFSAFKK